jgi:phosphopentomutase
MFENIKKKRVFLIVLDSFGIGELPDASDFSDEGANTLKSISKSNKFSIKSLKSLGLLNIDGVDFLEKYPTPRAAYGRLLELSRGKDTTTGHFEMMGIVSEKPMPTYPDGFPNDILLELLSVKGILHASKIRRNSEKTLKLKRLAEKK